MSDIEAVISAKQEVEDELLKRPDVTGVGVGYREKNGQETDELVICVYVAQKRPLHEVPPELRIPPEIRGVKTDVIELGPARYAGPTDVVRPLRGGAQIQVNCWGHTEYGTLGCLVWHYKMFPNPGDPSKELRVPVEGDGVYALTAAHVLRPHGYTLLDEFVYQPAAAIWFNRIGYQSDWKWGDKVDAALVRLDNRSVFRGPDDLIDPDNVVLDIGPLWGTRTRRAEIKDPVRKSGRSSGFTTGIVKNMVSMKFDSGVTLTDLMLIAPDPQWPAFCAEGDSGAVVVNGRSPTDARDLVGLVVGIFGKGSSYGLACHIDNVFEALKVTHTFDGQ